MDLKSLKLELLERIALLDDEERLLALKRLLDAPRGYGIPNENLSVVKEGTTPYGGLEDLLYTAQEVRALLDEVRERDLDLRPEDWAELEADHAAHLRGEGRGYTWEEVKEQLRRDRNHDAGRSQGEGVHGHPEHHGPEPGKR